MDILDEVGKHIEPLTDKQDINETTEHVVNITSNDDGELVQTPWAGGKDVGDMSVDELKDHLTKSTGGDVDVSEVIKKFMETDARRKSQISPKKKKAKKKIAKASRKKNRKK